MSLCIYCYVIFPDGMCLYFFFFFKQKTAYEMRISDWSSDVCSSDLPARRGSGGGVVRTQCAVGAQEPFARLRLELRADIHRRLVDMQRDRDLVAAGVGDGVVFVRRDQAAGAAGTGMHAAGGAEAETLAVTFEQLVLGDFQFAVPDALHAPQAAVVVDRRALSGRPG